MAEWNSGRDYLTRVANLRGTGSGPDFAGRLNGNFFLVAEGPGATVFDDNAADRLSGNGGRDWFFANLDSSPFDDMRDRKTDEVLIDID
jgi:fibronectin-binding autotransporter adhesin